MDTNPFEYKYHEQLREKARSIVNFKMHRTVFLLANILIWLVNMFLYFAFQLTWVWAIFPTSIWAVILIFHYFWVFKWNNDRIENEYQKLLRKGSKTDKILKDSSTANNQTK